MRPTLAPAVDDWFAKAFHAEHIERHQSAVEFARSFKQALAPSRGEPSPHSTPWTDRLATGDEAPASGRSPSPPPAEVEAAQTPEAGEPSPPPAAVAPPRQAPATTEATSTTERPRSGALGLAMVAVVVVGLVAWYLSEAPEGAAPVAPSAAAPSASVAKKSGPLMVPVGYFVMGCDPAKDSDCDQPPTRKVLEGFYVDRTEVTVVQYGACVAAAGCDVQHLQGDLLENYDALKCNWNKAGRERHPINCVTWKQAEAYCRWSGGRLPTAAQWEKAARGGKGRRYPWGDTEPNCSLAVMDDGNGEGCGRQQTWRVGTQPSGASPYGALDMAGNVREWTVTAAGPTGKGLHEVRGGGMKSKAADLQTWRGQALPADTTAADLGFRCVRTEF
jgi:formylglycine-generating enzyme required for sulfatase activity